MPSVLRILFFCRHNSVRAPLAAALAERIAAPKVEAFCAGLDALPMTPEVESTIVNLTGAAPKAVAELADLSAEGIGLIVVLSDKTHASPAIGAKLDEYFTDTEVVEWDMPAPTDDEDIKHLEIELAERLRLMFLARHLI
ncbi:hypothetical protein [Marinobacterium mangrovicola]|uniref:Protein-tyrosine-phosphatase n=1 Tax=Marinobacterium mangrovicola TaxID=1476959 RepID=A0A4R1GKX7_9GAMM|nr:hypothetical protein [Marinobacterium mangrovicola]TCK08788.1 protein-tyrosine-phosphatase [Marinobacterium mangrovicola]